MSIGREIRVKSELSQISGIVRMKCQTLKLEDEARHNRLYKQYETLSASLGRTLAEKISEQRRRLQRAIEAHDES